MVDETNDGLTSLAYPKCRTRYFAVVTHKPGLPQAGIDLHIDRLDLNLIVVEGRAVGVWNGAMYTLELSIL
jgi:hypothetical protein